MANLRELERFPISAFSVVMGLGGFALALRAADDHLALPVAGFGFAVTILTSAVFLVLAALYGLKLARFRAAVAAEWAHPAKLSFFPTLSIGLILLSAAWLPYAPGLARALILAGASLQLVLTVAVLSAWLYQTTFEIQHSSPAWFIPLVGNALVPIPGATLLSAETAWFFFSVGMVFWMMMFAILLNRLIFHSPLPDKLVPTFFIFIAPPSVGFIAYLGLVGELDAFARVLYHTALFLTLLMLVQLPRFTRVVFGLSWWAYSFPLAAVTVASTLMFARTGLPLFRLVAIGLLALLAVLVAVLLVRTAAATRRHGLALEQP
jgi:tellurite resistance protein